MRVKFLIKISCFFLSIFCVAQTQFPSGKLTKIIYESSYNGNVPENQNLIWVFADTEKTWITSEKQFTGQMDFPHEFTLIQASKNKFWNYAFLSENETISQLDTVSLENQKFELLDETTQILGYHCKKAKTSINSNTIEIWYTDELDVKASPNVLGVNLGVVLKFTRNGNFTIQAKEIKKEKIKIPEFLNTTQAKTLEKIDYQDKIWRSRFVTIPIFENQQIHWVGNFEKKENELRFANGTLAVKKVKFPKINPGSQIFIDLTEQSNGDAYDRTGSVFLIPTDKPQSFMDGLTKGVDFLPVYENGNGKKYQGITATETYTPLVELMRFFTPFGVHHFNNRVQLKDKTWQDSVFYRQDISDYASLLSEKEVYLGVFIGNYDQGGHKISMNITIHSGIKQNSDFTKVIPLFNTVNVMEMAGQEYSTLFNSKKGLLMEFDVPEDLENAELRYITTGHGGWENGDEFVPKKNTILLDEKIVFDLIPWREDCGSYRLYNPVSGNFANGLSSSDYSRSNWCPGTITQAYRIEVGNLKAGKHKIQVLIPQGEPEGNSFSAWNISAVLVGN
ncbi:MAG: GLPGLI family protein [Weeksellaceae bacterium]|jgi:hypothetical protein|nr:GLPGLI family protein [Weeksellaceae bacterium]